MPYKCEVPEIRKMLEGIPAEELPENEASFWQAVAMELYELLKAGARAAQPEIVMWDRLKTGEQYLWEFYVNDLGIKAPDAYNWHGQNVSKWLYAGAIALQGKRVSRHH